MANNVQQAPQTMQMIAPDLAAQQLQVQRQQQLADALRQQSMTPLDPNQMVTGAGPARAVSINKWAGLAKILQAGIAGNNQNDIDKKSLDIANQYNGRLAQVLGGGEQPAPEAQADPVSTAMASTPQNTDRMVSDGSSVPNMGPTPQALEMANQLRAQQPAPQAPMAMPQQQSGQQNNFGLANLLRGQAIESIGGNNAGSAFWDSQKPTEATRLAIAAGSDPRTANAGTLAKSVYIPDENIRPGGYSKNPTTGQVTNYPHIPEGFQAVPNGTGGFAIKPVDGSLAAITASKAATKAGENQQTLTPVNQLPVDAQGRPIPQTIANTIAQSQVQGLDISKMTPADISALAQKDPAAFAQGVAAFHASGGAPQGVGLALGQEKGADIAQTELSKKFTDLNSANQQAQTTNSYLQNIRGLADKAGVGGFSDKVQLTNNLLSYAGVSDKATDTVTAKNLLDKYANQITSRLGGGANGSDARSAIIEAAYPNSKMTPAAIKDAVDNIVGANDMTKAKASLLSPHANARDPVAYQKKEQVFDQNADPRIWQWKNIQDPAAKKAFAASVISQDPNFPEKIKALEDIGAF